MYTVYIILCMLQFVYYVYCIVYIVLYYVYYVVYIILCILYCVLKTLTFIILKCLQKMHPTGVHCTPLYCIYYSLYTILCILYFVYYTLYTILYTICVTISSSPPTVMVGELCFIDQIIRLIGEMQKYENQTCIISSFP